MGQPSQAREKLLSTAIELMSARSYADVGVQELCEHAAVKKGSFYHFFPSKRDLALAALDRQWEIVQREVLERAFDEQMPPLKRLERCFELFYDHHCGVKAQTGRVLGCPFGNLAGELSTQDEGIRLRVVRIFKGVASYIERALRDAVKAGEVPEMDTSTAAQAVVAYMEGIMLLAKATNEPGLIKQLGQSSIRGLVAGMAAPRTPPERKRRAVGE